MGTTSKGAPFVFTNGLPPVHNEHRIDEAGGNRIYPFRQWRPSPVQPMCLATVSTHDADPYLFVLLADQEFREQRPAQAESLIDAAYAAYDQCRWGS